VLDTGIGTFSFKKKHWQRPCGGSAINAMTVFYHSSEET